MDLLFTYNQEKSDKNNFVRRADLKVFDNKTDLKFVSKYYFEFPSFKKVNIEHELTLNLSTGDFEYTFIKDDSKKITKKNKKNDFKLLNESLERSENHRSYWGTDFKKAMDKVSTIFHNKIKNNFKKEYNSTSLFNHKSVYSFMYRLIVNYYLDKRDIKFHDGIYYAIEDNFPSKKWLAKNDNNFLPAVLDSYGIKSKYFIKELNVHPDLKINLKILKYICNLLGENYIDYIKLIDWKSLSTYSLNLPKKHVLSNEFEKRAIIKVINEYTSKENPIEYIIGMIYFFMCNKEDVKKMGIDLNFKFNNIDTFYKIYDQINGIVKHKKRGYRIRYNLPTDFVKMVENPIIFDGHVFTPKILLTEEDFIVEGHLMKNCMSTQFSHGIIFIYISLQSELGTIDLQYKKGKLIQSRGKANNVVPEEFKGAINQLTDRMMSNQDIKWIKEKFDII